MSGSSSPMFLKNSHGQYQVAPPDSVVGEAKRLLDLRVHKTVEMSSCHVVKDFLAIRLGHLEYEVFVVLFLDSQHRLIECQEMFRGTLNQTSVYPREVARVALALNAGAVILAHNHPSGATEPSRADEYLTATLKTALQLIDVRVLDHMVVGGGSVMSFAERGLL